MSEENEKTNVSITAIVCSFLFPLVGFILYFVNRKKVEDPNDYLKAAFWGIVTGFIIRIVVMTVVGYS